MPVIGLKKFERRMAKFAKTLPAELIVPFQKKIVLEIFSRLVVKTPVDTGHARNNWQITIGSEAQDEIDAPINELGALSTLGPFQDVYITNNVPYIERLDNGHSMKQAPAGMVTPTLNEVSLMGF